MKVDNSSHHLKIAGKILVVLGFLTIPVSVFSWNAFNFLIESDWWYDHVSWHTNSHHWSFYRDGPFRLFYYFPIFYLASSVIFIASGIGLAKEKEWAMRLVWIPAVILLFKFPIGTALGVWIIYLLQKRKEFLTASKA